MVQDLGGWILEDVSNGLRRGGTMRLCRLLTDLGHVEDSVKSLELGHHEVVRARCRESRALAIRRGWRWPDSRLYDVDWIGGRRDVIPEWLALRYLPRRIRTGRLLGGMLVPHVFTSIQLLVRKLLF